MGKITAYVCNTRSQPHLLVPMHAAPSSCGSSSTVVLATETVASYVRRIPNDVNMCSRGVCGPMSLAVDTKLGLNRCSDKKKICASSFRV